MTGVEHQPKGAEKLVWTEESLLFAAQYACYEFDPTLSSAEIDAINGLLNQEHINVGSADEYEQAVVTARYEISAVNSRVVTDERSFVLRGLLDACSSDEELIQRVAKEFATTPAAEA